MSRAFEVTREVDLPAAPDDVWTAITADTAAWQFPTGMEIPAGAAPPEGGPVTTWDPPHRLVIRMESPDGTFNALDYAIEARERRHGAPALRPQRDPRRRVGGPVRRNRRPHGLLPSHARAVPRALQRTPGHLRRPAVGRHRGPEAAGAPDAMDTLRAALGVAVDSGVGDAVHAVARRRRPARRRHRLLDARVPRRPHRRTACTASSGATTTAASSG